MVYRGPYKIRVDEKDIPPIEHPGDAIVRVTLAAICGSDLHLYHGHQFLTPVFGTSCPPKGLSGALHKLSYRKYSEGRAAHWLLLLAADRVDAWESHLRSFATLRPDNPITETGVLSEFRRHGISSRIGKKRADVKHLWLDPIIVAGPWVAAAGAVFSAVRAAARRRR
jgi:hypothetical protein